MWQSRYLKGAADVCLYRQSTKLDYLTKSKSNKTLTAAFKKKIVKRTH